MEELEEKEQKGASLRESRVSSAGNDGRMTLLIWEKANRLELNTP